MHDPRTDGDYVRAWQAAEAEIEQLRHQLADDYLAGKAEIERLRGEIAAHAREVEVLNDYCNHYRYLAEIRLAAVGRTRLLTDEDVEAVAAATAKRVLTMTVKEAAGGEDETSPMSDV